MFNNPKGGLGYAAEFQSSALPWCTASISPSSGYQRFDFRKLTRFITISNLESAAGKALRVGFTANGVTMANYYTLNPGVTQSFELRVKELYVKSDTATTVNFSVLAGLTNIDSIEMPQLSGSLPDGSEGWVGVG